MPIDFTHKAIFIHIPKTGGRAVSQLMGIQKDVRKNLYCKELTHMTLPMIKKHVDTKGYYVFTFVRDPYTRITSEYSWRMRNIMSPVFQEPVAYRLSFAAYMELLLERWDKLSSVWNERCHVVPQVEYLNDRVNIFRFEKIESECDVLKRMFGIDKGLQKVNPGVALPQHTERTREITRLLYRDDFKRLGYDNLA